MKKKIPPNIYIVRAQRGLYKADLGSIPLPSTTIKACQLSLISWYFPYFPKGFYQVLLQISGVFNGI
uniref:Macaca fascicularis brain cDNA clone: QflA-18557, similar to human FK506 binding protein 14, 22 kDa (FKBP14), mRNA, RefSeq: NM_017946.1 n=1 Tax=Macaca fascicularis TaxID=9541 RepID=I7GMW1_MACFA|nr:unnamed protein product [Macaca fascicularis]